MVVAGTDSGEDRSAVAAVPKCCKTEVVHLLQSC